MGGRIERIELAQTDVTKDIRDSIELTEKKSDALLATLVLIKETLADIKKNASTIKGGLLDLGKTNTKDLDARAKAHRTANQLAKDAIKAKEIEAKLIRDYEKLEAQREARLKKLADAEAKAHAKREKQYNKEIENANKLGAVYFAESKALNEMRNRYKDLAVQKEKGIKLTRDERNEMRSLLTQIDQNDKSLKRIDATVGQHQRNVGNYSKALGGVRNIMGQLGLAFGAGAFISNAKDVVVEFDNSIADLSAITGAAGKELDFFKKNAIQMGVDVKGGASAVVEAYKLIASAKPELLENAEALNSVTKSAILLARASGMELPDAATALTDAMNQFGADADQAAKFVDVLAAGAKFGSAEIPQITEALLKFGAVSKTSNVNIQESTALIEDLAEKGLKGADAGTALRNVMLKLSAPDALPKEAQIRLKQLGINFDDLRDKSKPFAERLESLKPLLNDNAALVKVFGTENAVAATTLLSTTDRIKELTAQVNENNVAQEQADARSKTLSEAYNRFKETINGLILEFVDGKNASGGLASALDFLRENIRTIISVVKQGAQAWITYKTVMMALRLTDQIKNFRDLGSGIKNATNNLTDAQRSAKGFGQALSGIGWTAIITALFEVAKAWYDVASGANQARFRVEQFNNAQSSGTNQAIKWLEKLQAKEKKALQDIEDRLSKGKISEKEAVKLRQQAIGQTEKIITQEKTRLQAEKALLQVQLGTARAKRDRVKEDFSFVGGSIYDADALNKAEFEVTRLLALEKRNTAEIIELNKALEGSSDSMHDLNIEQNELGKGTEESTKKVKELNTQLKEQNRYLSEQLSLTEQLNSAYRSNLVDEVQGEIDAELKRQVDSALKTGEFDNLLTQYKSLVQQRTEISIDGLKKEAEARKLELDRIAKEEYRKELENIIANRDELLSQEGLTQEQILIIQKQFDAQKAILDKDQELRLSDVSKSKLLIEEKLKDDTLEVVKKGENDVIEAKSKTLEAQKEFIDELGTATTEKLEKNYEDEKKWIELTTKFLEDQIDRRIAKLDEFTEASRKSQEDLRELANNGNIQAQQSIAREAELQREAQVEKQRLERQKAWLQVVSSFLQNYNNKLAEGKKGTQALAEAVTEKEVLESIIKTIPAFKDGGVHKDGGLMLVNDAPGSSFREIIETPKGELYSPEGRNVIMNAPKGTKIHTQDQWAELQNKMQSENAFRNANSLGGNVAGNSFDIAPLLKGINKLEKAIKNQPQTTHQFREVVSGLAEFVTTTKTGHTTRTITNQYRKRS